MILISATPSPFARKVRMALQEKGIAFEVRNEVPWHSDTATPQFNPLEQLPILIPPEGEPVYESSYILEWLEAMYPDPPLLPAEVPGKLESKRIQVLAEGVMDATVLLFFEQQRKEPSLEWTRRQLRKVMGGLRELDRRLGARDLYVADRFGLADIAVIAVLGMQNTVEETGAGRHWRSIEPQVGVWHERYLNLARFERTHRERPSVRDTLPVMFQFREAVV